MSNKSINTTTTLYLTVLHPPLYIPYTCIRVYVLHSRPTDFHSSTRLNSGPHSAELVQSTKTTNGPVVDLFSCSTHHLTSPPPRPPPHHHHHCHSHDAFSGCSIPCFCESLTEPLPTPQATPWLEHFFLSLSIALSPALSPGTHALYYVPVTRTVPVPFVFKRRRCGGVLDGALKN